MAEFFTPSQQVMDKITAVKGRKGAPLRYPWDTVPIGKSFIVDKTGVKFKTLQSLAYKRGKTYKRKFIVYEHDTVFEITRLPDPVEAPAKNIFEKIEKES